MQNMEPMIKIAGALLLLLRGARSLNVRSLLMIWLQVKFGCNSIHRCSEVLTPDRNMVKAGRTDHDGPARLQKRGTCYYYYLFTTGIIHEARTNPPPCCSKRSGYATLYYSSSKSREIALFFPAVCMQSLV